MSEISELTKCLQQQLEMDRRQIETLTRTELKKLAKNLKKSSIAELNTTLDGIAGQLTRNFKKKIKPLSVTLRQLNNEAELLQKMTLKAWVRSLILMAIILLSISVGSWGLMRWIYQSQVQRIFDLDNKIKTSTSALTRLKQEQQNWGISLVEINQEYYVVLPVNTNLLGGLTVGGKPAVKLSKN